MRSVASGGGSGCIIFEPCSFRGSCSLTHDKGKESSVVFVERKERASFRDKQGVIAPLIDGDIVDRGSDMVKCCGCCCCR